MPSLVELCQRVCDVRGLHSCQWRQFHGDLWLSLEAPDVLDVDDNLSKILTVRHDALVSNTSSWTFYFTWCMPEYLLICIHFFNPLVPGTLMYMYTVRTPQSVVFSCHNVTQQRENYVTVANFVPVVTAIG